MVIEFLILCLMLAGGTVNSVHAQPVQYCVSCHTQHYIERGDCHSCHRGNPASDRKLIAHAGLRPGDYADLRSYSSDVMAGNLLVKKLGCRRCHVIGNEGNLLASNLDAVSIRKTVDQLSRAIRTPVDAMPDFALDDTSVKQLVKAVMVAGGKANLQTNVPLRIHFSPDNGKKNVFTSKCGTCHRSLTKQGALGNGKSAPDLSGLFTGYYPHRNNDKIWTVKDLRLWLKNPRTKNPRALMPPVELSDGEFEQLISKISVIDTR